MDTKLSYVTLCRVVISQSGNILFNEVLYFPLGADPEKVIRREINEQVARKRVLCKPESFIIQISEIRKQAISSILTILRRCPKCYKTSEDLGISDDDFRFCGLCGRQTEWGIRKTK